MNDVEEVERSNRLTAAPDASEPRRPRSRAAARGQIDAVVRLLGNRTPDEVENFRKLLADTQTPPVVRGPTSLDEDLWGPTPSQENIATGEMANLRKQFIRRRAVEDTSLSRSQVAGLLGISSQAVTDALEARRLLGLRRGRSWLIPAWQLDAEAERGVLPEIATLAGIFPGGLLALSEWVVRPHVDLDGVSPRDTMASGDVAQVLALARSLTGTG